MIKHSFYEKYFDMSAVVVVVVWQILSFFIFFSKIFEKLMDLIWSAKLIYISSTVTTFFNSKKKLWFKQNSNTSCHSAALIEMSNALEPVYNTTNLVEASDNTFQKVKNKVPS